MNIKNTIIEHYRKFFDLHAKGIALDEDDHLNIDWAEDLVKNCFIPNVMQWVAVSERLPELEGRYLCMRKYKRIVSIENFYPEHPENWLKFTGVTHWMPIVEPPCA